MAKFANFLVLIGSFEAFPVQKVMYFLTFLRISNPPVYTLGPKQVASPLLEINLNLPFNYFFMLT